MPKPSKRASHEMTPLVGIGVLLTVVMVGVVGLVLAWRQFPKPDPILPPAPIVEPATGEVTRASCEAAHGQWTDCGSPCHGKPGVMCAQVCEPQCLCGGTQGWSCPKDFVCTDWDPSQQDPAAIGVCREGEASEEPEASAGAIAREKPEGSICDETNSICVDEGYQNDLLTSPFTVTGTAVAFEQQFSWRLWDSDYTRPFQEGTVMTQAPDAGIAGSFVLRSFISSPPKTPTGTLVLYEASPKDGYPIHELKIPVRFTRGSQTVQICTVSPIEDPDAPKFGCEPVEIMATKLPIEATLNVLLAYENDYNLIPRGTKLLSVNLKAGILSLIFSRELDGYGGGSATVEAIRGQIEETLKQFSSVKNVVISVEGKTPEETLQP